MKNLFRKIWLTFIVLMCSSAYISADIATYDFNSDTELNRWTFVKSNESNVNYSLLSKAGQGWTSENANDKFLDFTLKNKGNQSLTMTTNDSYANITEISFDAVSQDDGKPSITLRIVKDNDQKEIILDNKKVKSDLGAPGNKKWKRGYTCTLTTPISGKIEFFFLSSSSGKEGSIDNVKITYTGTTPPALKSSDATLKDLQVDGTTVSGFNSATHAYSVLLPASYAGMPVVSATANDAKATASVTQATAIPGTASVLVTAEDGTTLSYTIAFTCAEENTPSITSFTVAGVQATINQTDKTITATLPLGTSLTALTPTVAGENIASYTPQGAQDFSAPVQYTVLSAAGKSVTYTVTLSVEQPKSSDATLAGLTVGGKSVTLQSGILTYTVDAEAGGAVPQVSATPHDSKAKVVITQASSLTDKATIVVTAEDGTTLTYTITFNVKVPSSDLTIHTPGIFEAEKIAGGYGGTLTPLNGREYEVYYAGRDADDNATIGVTGTDRVAGITKNETTAACEAADGWFKGTIESVGSATVTATEEFTKGTSGREHRMNNGHSYTFHISGYDQFSILAKDKKQDTKGTKPTDNQYFEVYIDGILQPLQFNKDSYTIRRYDITTGEHVISVKAINGQSRFVGFSLRVADEPRVSWLRGNDSTQSILQTRSIAPVTYYTKYNAKGRTALEWQGAQATGITLTNIASDGIGDTLRLEGTANCPVGTYIYKVVAYNQSGVVTNSLTGQLSITSKIEATSDTIQDGFTNEAIDGFTFRYYALSPADIILTWTQTTPAGITGQGNNGTYTISGTPTQPGVYPFTVTVLGGNSVSGKLTVTTFDPGNDPILYLYKNTGAYEKDGVYLYLKSQGKNLVPRKAQDALRDKAQYDKYTWVIISEDVDANNAEIMALARGNQISMPVLNMKSFSYSENRLDWGDPDNGSLNNRSVRVVQAAHPIIKAIGKKQGDEIQVLDTVIGKGLMPAAVDYQGTLCLATATTRGETYTGDGHEETFLHEVPATLRNGKKYISFPLAIQSSQRLTAEGKRLLDACINYLLGTTTTIALPELRITSFAVDGNAATIYQDQDSINLVMPEGTDLTALVPEIKVSDPTTHILCKSALEDGSVDFSNSNLKAVIYTVSDYINVRHYVVTITAIQPMAIDEVYQSGEWVNIYDIQGRKIATTNEDIYSLALPRGIYLVQTTHGTLKIMK